MSDIVEKIAKELGYEHATINMLPTYEIVVDGKRKAIVEFNADETLGRIISDGSTNWLSANLLTDLAFEQRLREFVKKHFNTHISCAHDGKYRFLDADRNEWWIECRDGKAKFTTDDEWEETNDFFKHWEETFHDDI